MSRLIAGYVSAAAAFLLLDMLWLAVIALPFYRGRIGALLLEKPNLPVGLLFYAVFVIGIVVFAILPGLRAHSVWPAVGYGALFGGLSYATYDLTNLAVLRGWSVSVSVVDIGWGTVLTGAVSAIGYLVAVQFD